MILVDANVLMYASGAEHDNKSPAIRFLARVVSGEVETALDAEVLQEILHRYSHQRRWIEGQQVYLAARGIFPTVLPITAAVIDHAKGLMDMVAS